MFMAFWNTVHYGATGCSARPVFVLRRIRSKVFINNNVILSSEQCAGGVVQLNDAENYTQFILSRRYIMP